MKVLTPFEVAAIHGADRAESVNLSNNKTDEHQALEVQDVVAALGLTADVGPSTRWGLEQRSGPIDVDSGMRTSLPRVFSAGDITEHDGKVQLLLIGLGEAATAVTNATAVVHPGAKLFPGHSSEFPWPGRKPPTRVCKTQLQQARQLWKGSPCPTSSSTTRQALFRWHWPNLPKGRAGSTSRPC